MMTKKFTYFLKVFLGLIVFSFLSITFAETTASISNSKISKNESIILTITTDQSSSSAPDLTALKTDFSILNQQQSTNYSNINGKFSHKTTWSYEIMPLKQGQIIIPSMTVDQEKTKSIPLTVTKASTTAQTDDISLTLSTDQSSAYVQESILVSLKLRYRTDINIRKANIDSISSDKGKFTQLSRNSKGHETINGETYNTVTINFIGHAIQSGELKVNPITSSFFYYKKNQQGVTQPVRINLESNTLKFNIKPEPDASVKSNNPWLPAKSLLMSQHWDIPTKIKVGTPITREITLNIVGLDKTQIPEIKLDDIKGANSYPDDVNQQTKIINHDYSTVYNLSTVIIAKQAGKLVIPDFSIQWFNTQTNKTEITTVKGKTINVIADPNAAPTPVTPPSQSAPPKPSKPPIKPEQTKPPVNDSLPDKTNNWKWIAIVLVILWIITFIPAVYFLKKRKQSNPVNQEQTKPTVIHLNTLSENNLEAIQKTLIDWWNNQEYPHITSLGQMADLVFDSEVKSAIKQLESDIYTASAKPLSFDWQRAIKQKRLSPNQPKNQDDILPKLYSTD